MKLLNHQSENFLEKWARNASLRAFAPVWLSESAQGDRRLKNTDLEAWNLQLPLQPRCMKRNTDHCRIRRTDTWMSR